VKRSSGFDKLLPLLTDKEFVCLWAIGGLRGAVRWLEILVIGIYTFQVSGSPFVVAMMLVSRMMPMVLFGTVIGAIAENMDRRRILICTCGVMALSAGIGGLAAAADMVSLPLLAILAFINGLGWATDWPVRRTLVGDVVEARRLSNAMSLESLTNSATRMIGPLVGGLAFQTVGLDGAYIIASFIYGLTLLLAIRLTPPQTSNPAKRLESLFARLQSGLKYVRSNQVIVGVLIITVIINLFGFCYVAILPAWASENFQVKPMFVGLLASAEGAGAVFGSVVLALRVQKKKYFQRLFLIGAVTFVGCLFIAAQFTIYGVAVLILFCAGIGIAGFTVMQSTIILNETAPEYRSRIMGILAACIGAGPLGVINIGMIAELTSAGTAIAISGALGMSLIAFLAWRLPTIWR
jgi:MFS family permease